MTVFRAPEAPLDIPAVALTPWLLARVEARGEHPAFIDGTSGAALSSRDWAMQVRRAAAGLVARGLRRGEVVGIYSPNGPAFAVAFHAVSLAGGVSTTVNPLDTASEVTAQLRDAGARWLIAAPPQLARAREAAATCALRELFLFAEASAEGATPFAALLTAAGGPSLPRLDPRSDLVALPYSSGTTGLPKGVMLTHHNLVANVLQTAAGLGVLGSDVMLGVLPFFHAYGMTASMNVGLWAGAPVVTLPSLELEPCLAAMARHRVTFAPMVPPLVLGLAKHPAVDAHDLSRLHTVFSGAAPLQRNLAMAASARLGCRVVQGYGLAETSPVTHATRPGSDRFRVTSVGPPVPNTEAKVIDVDSGRELGPNEEGEICVRGPQVMKGYLDRPEATAAMIDADGWLHTGDVGYADHEGSFFVVDRLKELIKYQGLQVAPAELEALLLTHPAVVDAAVVPLADQEAGQVPMAFVVLSGEVTPAQLMGWVAERVASYKELHAIEVADRIPRSPAGKILRRVLAERWRAGTGV